MTIDDVKTAWNNISDKGNGWDSLDADERVSFALRLIKESSAKAMEDLGVAVYNPGGSALSVCHAMNHLKEILCFPSSPVSVDMRSIRICMSKATALTGAVRK